MQRFSSLMNTISFGKIASLIWFIAHFTLLPKLARSIWPYLLKIPDHLFPMTLTIIVVTLVFSIYNIVMYFVYTRKYKFCQQYRVSNKPWLWESNPQQWRKLIKKTILIVLMNSYLLMPLTYLIQYSLVKQQYEKSLQLWPSTFTIFWQSMFFLLMEDFGFYWSHYLFHKTRLYKLHKIHHQHVMTVTIAASYAHPLQAFLSNALPGVLGAIILSKFITVHYATLAIWFVFGLVQTCQAHSGYQWSWRQLSFFPWKMGPEYHGFHHSTFSQNIGSIFIFWDNIMNTNSKYKVKAIDEQKSQQ